MAVKPIPEGYHTITPYLIIPKAADAIDFLKRALDAKEKFRMTEPGGRLRHAELVIGDSPLMLGEPPENHPICTGMFYLYVADVDAMYHRAIDAGGKSVSPLRDEPYGDRTGAVSDPSGNIWWMATHQRDIDLEEMKKHAAGEKK
jgi:PhnB protein